MKINLFKYPIGTVVKHVQDRNALYGQQYRNELYGHVLGFKQDLVTKETTLDVQWSDGYRHGIPPEFVTTYNDL